MLLPKENAYVSGAISVLDSLVKEGEETSLITLPHHLHSFLVECLAEHLRDTDIVHHVLALNLLNSVTKLGEQGNVLLKRTGDEALLLAGLFPERVRRLHVSSSYFRLMGQAAYAGLAVRLHAIGKKERGRFYDAIAEDFRLLEKVLNAARARPETEWDAFQRFRARLQ